MLAALFALIFGLAPIASAQEARLIYSDSRFEVFTLDPALEAGAAIEPVRILSGAIAKFPELPWPEKIQIGLMKEGAVFRSSAAVIFGVTEFSELNRGTGKRIRLKGKNLEALWIHELGHVLMHVYLKDAMNEALPRIREKLLASYPESKHNVTANLERPLHDAVSGFGQGRLSEVLFRIFTRDPSVRINDDNLKATEILRTTSTIKGKLWESGAVLQELFADVLVAAVTGDRRLLVRAIEKTDGPEISRYRALERQGPLRGFFNRHDPYHSVMAPARLKAGELLTGAASAGEFVRAAAAAVSDVAAELWKDPERAYEISETLSELSENRKYDGRTDLEELNEANAKFARLNRALRSRLIVRAGAKSCRALLGD